MSCTGTTKAGNPCKAPALHGSDTCISHSPKEVQESAGFGGSQPGAGRPPNPRAVDLLRERIEGNIDRWLAPLEEALEATKVVVSGKDGEGFAEVYPDFAIRLRAVAEGFDRAYGKPKQATEVSGPDGGAIPVSAVDLSRLSEEELREYRRLTARAQRSDD